MLCYLASSDLSPQRWPDVCGAILAESAFSIDQFLDVSQ